MELRFDYEQARKENPRLKVRKRTAIAMDTEHHFYRKTMFSLRPLQNGSFVDLFWKAKIMEFEMTTSTSFL